MIRINAGHIKFDGDGRAWWVVDEVDLVGEPCVMLEAGRGQLIKPLDRPCDTCGGGQKVQGMFHAPGHLLFDCPDCIDGRHTFEIETECDNGSCSNSAPIHHCVRCGGWPSPGFRKHRVSVVPGMILPIQKESAYDCETIWDRGDGTYWYVTDSGDHEEPPEGDPAYLPSAAAPGMFAVELKVAP